MSAPTPVVRAVMLERDGERCAACGARVGLEAQHRQATGMGGRKTRPKLHELLTLCTVDNNAVEAALQGTALRFGWKVKKWVTDCALVPVYFLVERAWFRLTPDGRRVRLTATAAAALMRDVYGPEYDEWGR